MTGDELTVPDKLVFLRDLIRETLDGRQRQLFSMVEIANRVVDSAEKEWHEAVDALAEFDVMRRQINASEGGADDGWA